jgi:AcrR family transcriptional regulator
MVMRQTNPSGAAPAGLTEPDYGEAKTRILLTAERLFAEHGYSGASLRAIMAEAGVNTAAIHYYFRNKEGLLRAIFEMRVSSMNAERAERLGAIEAATSAGDTRPEISAVLRAFIEPLARTERASFQSHLRALFGGPEPRRAAGGVRFLRRYRAPIHGPAAPRVPTSQQRGVLLASAFHLRQHDVSANE